MSPAADPDRAIDQLAAELRRLESEYTKFFAGRAARPPLELRAQVERLFRGWDRRAPATAAARFRLQALQSRLTSFMDMWDRSLRAREEGRAAGLSRPRGPTAAGEPRSRNEVYAAVLRDPAAQPHEVRALYEAAMEARRQTGHDVVPFEHFAGLVERESARLRAAGAADLVFRVTVVDGRPNLTVRPFKRHPQPAGSGQQDETGGGGDGTEE